MLLEIGTGVTYEAGVNIFGVSFFKWSSDGRFLIIGTVEGRIAICECDTEIKENIWDVLGEMRHSIFYWDQWTLGASSITDSGAFPEENLDNQQRFDKELTSMLKSTKQSRMADESYIQYQNLHEATPLMVHANPYFKYSEKDRKFKAKVRAGGRKRAPRGRSFQKKKMKNASESEGSVLFLNRGNKKLSYRQEIERAKNILTAANRMPMPSSRDKKLRISSLRNKMSSRNFNDFVKKEIKPETMMLREQRQKIKMENERKRVRFEKEKMRRYASQGQFRPATSNFKVKRNVVKLYPRKLGSKKRSLKRIGNPNKRREMQKMSNIDNRAKLLYGIHSSNRFKPKRSIYKDRIQDYGYSSIPKIDSSMRFNSLMVAKKDDSTSKNESFSKTKLLIFLDKFPSWNDVSGLFNSGRKDGLYEDVHAYQEDVVAKKEKGMILDDPDDVDLLD